MSSSEKLKPEGKRYPDPLASHKDIVNDSTLFWDTLRRFHFVMGTKFMIPVIGGKELDLHVLYTEVAKRGGYEKVVAEKKWREVGSVFKFSPTTTSASFVLRKHYLSLLYHYEQVYLFKVHGPLPAPAAALQESSCRNELAVVAYESKTTTAKLPEPRPEGRSGFKAVGTIEGKFDFGYLVSVKLGSETLHGVLYHPAEPGPLVDSEAIVPYNSGRRRRRSCKRRSRRREDPSHPKPNRSGYNFFFAEEHYKLKSLYPRREREFTKIIGESWNKLSAEERMVYQKIGLRDKERYKREMQEYRERLKQRQGLDNAEAQPARVDEA